MSARPFQCGDRVHLVTRITSPLPTTLCQGTIRAIGIVRFVEGEPVRVDGRTKRIRLRWYVILDRPLGGSRAWPAEDLRLAEAV